MALPTVTTRTPFPMFAGMRIVSVARD